MKRILVALLLISSAGFGQCDTAILTNIVRNSPTAVTVNFTQANIGNVSGIQLYYVRQGFTDTTSTVPALTLSRQITGLQSNTNYRLQIRTFCSFGGFVNTYNYSFRITDCDTVASSSVSNITATTARVNFSLVQEGTSYAVVLIDMATQQIIQTINTTGNSVNFTGLQPNKLYGYEVETVCGGVNSTLPALRTFTTVNGTAQRGYTPMKDYGYAYKRIKADTILLLPPDTTYSKEGVALKAGIFYVWNGNRWAVVTGGGGGGSTDWADITNKPANFTTTYALSNDVRDSIQNRVRSSKYSVDSANFYILINARKLADDSTGGSGYYTRGRWARDSSIILQLIASKLPITDTANIRLRPIAGSNMTITGTYPNLTFASSGGGGGGGVGTLQQVTDLGNSTTNNIIVRDIRADRGNGTGAYLFGGDATRYIFYNGADYVLGFLDGGDLNQGLIWHSKNRRSNSDDDARFIQKNTIDSLTRLTINGTGGSGYLQLNAQSTKPPTPTNGITRLFSNANGRLSWLTSNGFARSFNSRLLAADAEYTFKPYSFIVADSAEVRGQITQVGRVKTLQSLGNQSTSVVVDVSTSRNAKVTLTGNCTLTISNAEDGDFGTLRVQQDGTGARRLTPPSGSFYANNYTGTDLPLSTIANRVDLVYWERWDGVLYFSVGNSYKSN